MKYLAPFLAFVLAMSVVAPRWSQAGSGLYLSGEVGANFASGLDTTGISNDRASVCDEYINPGYGEVETSAGVDSGGKPYSTYNCTGPNRGSGSRWQNKFDGATGILAGAAVGYSFAGQHPNSSWGGFRVEVEYLYRQSNYDQTSDIRTESGESRDKLRDEIVQATDRIGSLTSHHLFGNLFYDFRNTSRFTPYIGIGGGVGFTDIENGGVWARNSDPDRITTGSGLPNADEIRRNLAGTVSVGQPMLSDTLFGLQVLFGMDYAITEEMSLGLKGRWVNFSSFRDDRVDWQLLRSHPLNLRKDGSEPVWGRFMIDDIEFFGISVNLKYHF
ncbi:MAG: hypothetical protein F4090_00290 [Nitrospira sp. SB0672_bin_25]|nr:hypothetical protein [Nitrospira sp. SB0666_bin_27]MYF24564.1 hypothetical protein [Nitrospira sp. SB0678_bin_10]MYJ53361.1 hypothetical protein [Nitrospira sp. SB0672_bin_25]